MNLIEVMRILFGQFEDYIVAERVWYVKGFGLWLILGSVIF